MRNLRNPQTQPGRKTAGTDMEVNRIEIKPLDLWSALRRTQPVADVDQKWPQASGLLCWHCCHGFAHVPSLLPVNCDEKTGVFVFTGNFCSWNCVKQYAFELQKRERAPPGVAYIGMLTFLTCFRTTECDDTLAHEAGLCSCVEEFSSVPPARPRECLEAFGGTVTLEEYRRGFLCIMDYDRVVQKFHGSRDLEAFEARTRRLPRAARRAWGFSRISYPAPKGSIKEYVRIFPYSNRVLQTCDTVRDHESEAEATSSANANAKPEAAKKKRKRQAPAQAPAQVETKPAQAQGEAQAQVEAPIGLDSFSQQPHLQGTVRPRPAARRGAATAPPTRVLTNEQLVNVNEEQAYYTRNLRQYGNLIDAMGISIKRAPT